MISAQAADVPHAAGSVTTSVYRYYDKRGALIYVGITRQGMGRNLQHNSGADWWPYVTRQEVEHYATRVEAAAREKALIRQFRPPFNKQHNIGWQELRAVYLAYAAADAQEEDLLAAFQRTSRSLALRVVEHVPEVKRLVLRSAVEDAQVGINLYPEHPLPRIITHGPNGRVLAVERLGGFALIDCRISEPRPILTAQARVRFVVAREGRPAYVQLGTITLTPARDD